MALVAWLPFVLSIAVAFVSAVVFFRVSDGRQITLPHLIPHRGHTRQNRLAHTKPFSEKMLTEVDTSVMISLGLGFVFLWLIGAVAFVHAFW
jgi:putative exporter of polyketide antibiotics